MSINSRLPWFSINKKANIYDIYKYVDFFRFYEVESYLVINYYDILGKSGIDIVRFETEKEVLEYIQEKEDPSKSIVFHNGVLVGLSLDYSALEGSLDSVLDTDLSELYEEELFLDEFYWVLVKEDKLPRVVKSPVNPFSPSTLSFLS